MSIDIRWLTNGRDSVVVVRNSGVDPVEFDYYDKPGDVPIDVRHYCPDGVHYVGPDCARMFNVQHILYPNFPKCGKPGYEGKSCIAESCCYAIPTYHECPYFDKTYTGR